MLPPLPDPYVLADPARLDALMKQHKHSYRTLASAAHVGKTPIHKLRHGTQKTCSFNTASRIADALGVAVGDLFRPLEVANR